MEIDEIITDAYSPIRDGYGAVSAAKNLFTLFNATKADSKLDQINTLTKYDKFLHALSKSKLNNNDDEEKSKSDFFNNIHLTESPITQSTEGEELNLKIGNDFVSLMSNAYIKAFASTGIAKLHNLSQESLREYIRKLVALDALESGWGKHKAGKNNYGGIKKGSTFRDFEDIDEFAEYKLNLLNNSRYHAFDGNDFYDNIINGGYCPEGDYRSKLETILKQIS